MNVKVAEPAQLGQIKQPPDAMEEVSFWEV
jgi:hypothetical protein